MQAQSKERLHQSVNVAQGARRLVAASHFLEKPNSGWICDLLGSELHHSCGSKPELFFNLAFPLREVPGRLLFSSVGQLVIERDCSAV